MKHALWFSLFVLLALTPSSPAAELGDGWESRDPAVRTLLCDVSFADERNGWACGIRTIIHTSNGGRTWRKQWAGKEGYWINSVAALSPDVAVACGFRYGHDGPGIVLRTADAGKTWNPIAVDANKDAAYCSMVFRPDRTTGYLISNRSGLHRTTDAGLTWQHVQVPSYPGRCWVATHKVIAIPDADTIIVGGERAINRSTDGGKTWSVLPLPAGTKNPHDQIMYLRFATPDRGWINMLGGASLQTTDGGQTWERSTAPGEPFFISAREGWALNGYNVAHSADGGLTWDAPVRIGGGQARLVALTASAKRVHVVGGGEGTGTPFIADRLRPGITEEKEPDGVIPITFNLPEAGYATIQILNDRDEVVENVVAGQPFPAGENTVYWNLSTLADYWPPFASTAWHLYKPPAEEPRVATPGTYRWRGLWHPGLSLEYKHSFYPIKKHGMAWITPDKTGGWLGDHAPPQTLVRTGDTMWVGTFCEGGNAILEADLDMRKLWGEARLHLACPKVLAADGDAVYFIEQGGWLGFGGQQMAMIRVDRKTREAKRILSIAKDDNSAGFKNVRGFVVRGTTAYIADRDANQLVVVDLAANLAGKGEAVSITKRIPLPQPGRLRVYDANRLACVSANQVVWIDLQGDAITPAVTGLESPMGLAVDTAGNFYVGEEAPLHQVKVFSPEGKLLRTIGKPGPHVIGAFDMDNLESPVGVEVDANGNVWVAECNDELKRTSVWGRDGHCINQVLGPTVYGGGGDVDPLDENRFFYNGKELRRDPATGEIRLVNIIWRNDDRRFDRFVPKSTPHNFGGPSPAYPFHRNGKLFFRMWGGWGLGSVTTLFVYDRDQVRPVAAAGKAPGWLAERFKKEKDSSFAWTDRNDDGEVQDDEVEFGKIAGGAVWGVRMNENFDLSFSTVQGPFGVSFFHPESSTPRGYPVYRLPTEFKMVPNFTTRDPSTVQAVFNDARGNAIAIAPWLISVSPEGKVNWRYKCRWPGLHAGLSSSSTGAEPGVLVAPIRFYGSAQVSDALGEVFCIGSNYGATDLFTTDGLYVGRAFLDSRRGDAWSFNRPPTPEQIKNVSLSQEHFGGTFQRVRAADGTMHDRYVVGANSPAATVVELHGLDRVLRFPETRFTVTEKQWSQAEEIRQRRAVEAKEEKRLTVRKLADITIDGKASDWPEERADGFALGHDDKMLYVLYQGRDDRAVFQNAATRSNFVEAFIHGDVVDVMLQTNPKLKSDRNDAGVGDIRLSFALVDGRPTAILYDYVVPGTPAGSRLAFSSWQTIFIDKVSILDGARVAVTREGDNYTLEAAVPLDAIHLQLTPGMTLSGDVGRVLSDQSGTTRVDRIYWSNPNTRTVKDLPTEARLQPNLWGTFLFE